MSSSSLTPSIIELAAQITKDAAVVDDFLKSHSFPPLSMAEDGLPFFPGLGPTGLDPFPTPPDAVIWARDNLRESCDTLGRLVATPAESLIFQVATTHLFSNTCLKYVNRYKIAFAVPPQGSVSYKDLAVQVGVDQSQCTCIIRTLITQFIFQEPVPGMVSHTAMSKLLTVPSMRDSVGYILEEGFVGAPLICEASEIYKGSQERNHAPWNYGHNIDLPIFDFFETNPDRMTQFIGNMESLGGSPSFNIKHGVTGYAWDSIGKGTVVDLGGSLGHLSIAISKVAPQLEFVVQDLEKVVNEMNLRTETNPIERVRWQAHDFFKPQTIKGAEVYLFRWILHDYSDKYAALILQALVPAMGPNSRIILVDEIMPPPGAITKVEERKARSVDMEMMLTYNAINRDIQGWEDLFNLADPRLKIKSVNRPPGSAHSIIEVVLEGV